MLYGEEKQRQMARSILPSKSRKSARINAAIVKRNARRATRQALHVWSTFDDALDFEGHLFDSWDPRTSKSPWSYLGGVQGVMWERRDADKLAPVMRWAVAVTAHLDDPEDRLNYMKRVLPDNLIGRHALGHLKVMSEFEVVYDHEKWYRRRPADVEREGRRNVASVLWAVKRILSCGGHAEVNRRLRAAHAMGHRNFRGDFYNCTGCDLRLLGGLHDVEDFAKALADAGSMHGTDVDAVVELARELSAHPAEERIGVHLEAQALKH